MTVGHLGDALSKKPHNHAGLRCTHRRRPMCFSSSLSMASDRALRLGPRGLGNRVVTEDTGPGGTTGSVLPIS